MAEYDLYQADAFAGALFKGNRAAVMPLQEWLPDEVMQAIAAENNLAETAFVIPRGPGQYDLRWFTPGTEVDLCGHATLATAHILFTEFEGQTDEVPFETRSGSLKVIREAGRYAMDFPAYLQPVLQPERLDEVEDALGVRPQQVLSEAFLLAVFEDAETIRNMQPDLMKVLNINHHAHDGCVLVTAPGDQGFDFISRFFAPGVGIPEDPVTGSAHCMLTPYWAGRLGKNELSAHQASPRGGDISCLLRGERIVLKGKAVTYLRGQISL